MPVFQSRGVDFLTSPLSSDPSKAGIAQGLFGTFLIAILVSIFAFPIGIATAVYLEEYAPDNPLTRFININISNLAGVPSIIYGILGLAVFVLQRSWLALGPTVLAGGLDPFPADPAGRHHRVDRGDQGCATGPARGCLRPRRNSVADGPVIARSCPLRRPAS